MGTLGPTYNASTYPRFCEVSGEYNIMDEEEEEVVIPFIDEATANQLSRERTKKQLKTRQYTVGFHHGKLNPLPSNWRYPKGLTLIQLINFGSLV